MAIPAGLDFIVNNPLHKHLKTTASHCVPALCFEHERETTASASASSFWVTQSSTAEGQEDDSSSTTVSSESPAVWSSNDQTPGPVQAARPPPLAVSDTRRRGSGFLADSWCRTHGAAGVLVTFLLIFTSLYLSITIALHCTPLPDVLMEEENALSFVAVTLPVQIAVGILCSLLLLKNLEMLVRVTCLSQATKKRWYSRGLHKYRCYRMCQWYYAWFGTSKDAPFFSPVAFTREVIELVLQTINLQDMSEAGIDATYLRFYAVVIFLNSLSSLLLTPQFHGAVNKQRGLLFDALCDTFYGTAPLIYLVFEMARIFGAPPTTDVPLTKDIRQRGGNSSYGSIDNDLFPNASSSLGAYQQYRDADLRALMVLAKAESIMLGGTSAWEVAVKLATRVTPFLFAIVRLKSTLMMRKQRRMLSVQSTRYLPRLRRFSGSGGVSASAGVSNLVDAFSFLPASFSPRKARMKATLAATAAEKRRKEGPSFFSRGPRDLKLVKIPKVCALLTIVAAAVLCAVVIVRTVLLQCPETDLWRRNCLAQSHPVFSFDRFTQGSCPCHTLVARRSNVYTNGTSQQPADCRMPGVLDELQDELFKNELAAKYTRTLVLEGCSPFNCAHLKQLSRNMANLRILSIAGGHCKEMPYSIAHMTALIVVDLRDLGLRSLSPALGFLKGLRELGVSGNDISNLPNDLASASTLVHVDLSRNQFAQIPSVATEWPALRLLNLTYNRIQRLPQGFLDRLPSGARVLGGGNPVCSNQSGVVSRGGLGAQLDCTSVK